MRIRQALISPAFLSLCLLSVVGQQTNPVERQVANPITDTPNINPVSAERSVKPAQERKTSFEREGGDGEVVVYSDRQTAEGEDGKRVIVYTGNVDVRYGIYRLQADKITLVEAEDRMNAEGNVIFDQGDDQRITGTRGVWNIRTKLGSFEESTGFTNQTDDGTVLYFSADRVERVSLDEVVVTNGVFTSCDEAVPKWSFTAKEARVKINDRVRLKGARFKVRDFPLLPLPYASIPIKKRDRASGFLTPTVGYSANKGLRISGAYYQTLGRSADVTVRGDLYSSRGFGYGLDLRTRANSRSYFNAGFYAVKDRVLGPSASAENPDQGGSLVYAEGVHFFPNGFTAAADVRLTSNLDFRQVFSDGIQQIISPIEVSQVFVNKSWDNYTLNLLARSQTISIPNVTIKTRNLPSINFEKRPSMLSFLNPAYFSFKTSIEGVSRRESAQDQRLYFQQTGSEPVVSPAIGQRLDFNPQVILPLSSKYFNVTATAGGRITYYSNSFNDMRRVVGDNLIRKYGEFELDLRPVALARNYYGKNDSFRFRHVIEPYATYRFVKGINNFRQVIRFDSMDTITDTNEIEFGLINRIYTRKYSEAVTDKAQRALLFHESSDGNKKADSNLNVQPYEIFNLTVRGKYFFDKRFGGALVPGQRNQIAPITSHSFYTFGGAPRRFSPLAIDMTYRPQRTIFVNTRADIGFQGDGLRAVSATVGYDTPLLKLFQTFYYTRAVTLIPSLAQFADERGKEAGTLRGSQWSPSVFIGSRDKGPFAGASVFFDFENRRATQLSPLISSLYTAGYASNCCSMAIQYYTFNVGARNENRIVFSFRLNGIGSFGTEQFGQGLR